MQNKKHLFQKVAHDILDCITSYEECVRIIKSMESSVNSDTFNTLLVWNHIVEDWRLDILSQTEHIEAHSETSTEWADSINKIGLIVEQSAHFKAEMQSLILPNEETVRQLVETAIRQSVKLELINQALKEQDYQKLWVTEHW